MTRKKFIKLLMSYCVSRDQAIECADFALKYDIPYKDFYERFRKVLYTKVIKEFEQYILYGTDRTYWAKLKKEDLTCLQ